MLYAAILAGGTGSRMGADMPKQFLSVGGQPVLFRTVRRFAECSFDRIYVVVVEAWLDYAAELLQPLCDADDRIRVIAGGSDRTGSLMRALCDIEAQQRGCDIDEPALLSCDSPLCGNDIIVTHDAVRPFVSRECILASIDAAACGCAGVAIPSVDTVIRSADGQTVESIPPRSQFYLAQTPQTFVIGAFLRCLAAASPEQRAAFTDVCGVFNSAGQTVRLVEGSRTNIKITTPFDLKLAECIAADEQ